MLSLLAAGEMLRPFNKSRRETESGNLGTVVGAVPGLYGSGGVSSEEPVEETGTVEVEELRAGSFAHAVAPSLSEELPPVSLPFCHMTQRHLPIGPHTSRTKMTLLAYFEERENFKLSSFALK